MGSYENIAVRDAAGNITGYQSTTTGQYSPGTGTIRYVESGLPPVATQSQQVPSAPSFDPNSAAGIAQEISRSGGKTTSALVDVAAREGFTGNINVVSGIETVPIRTNTQLPSAIPATIAGPTADIYMPVGEFSQVRIPNAKAVVSESGELGVYQQYYIGGKLSSNLMLVGGGGRAALQSGMFSINEPLTTRVYERGQLGRFEPLPSGYKDLVSRLGAEAYGGYSGIPLDARTIESSKASLSTYTDPNNLANLVSPEAVNAGKAALPGAQVPSELSAKSPTIQFADEYGLTGRYINVEGPQKQATEIQIKPSESKMLPNGDLGLPKPFVSSSVETPAIKSDIESALPTYKGYGGGLLGQLAFGDKAPEVIKGGIGSVIDVIPSWFGFTPVADTMRVTDTGYSQFKTQRETAESDLARMQDYGKSAFGTNTEGKIIINAQNPEAVAFQKEYESTGKKYDALISSGIEKGYLSYSKGGVVETKDQFTYDYGEFSKWGVGAGKQVRESLGFTQPQLEAYGVTIESKSGVETIPEKLVYGAGYTLSTRPEKIVTAVGAGALLLLGGEVLGTIAETPAVASRLATIAQSAPMVATASKVAVDVGIPVAFLGATYYGASEGLKATPERTTINIGKTLPEFAGMTLGGVGAYGLTRVADAGYIGFVSKETKYIPGYEPRIIDLTKVSPVEAPKVTGSIESPLDLPAELISRPSLKEPYVMVGSTRYSYEALAERAGNVPTAPERISVMTGADIDPLSTASGFAYGGPATFQEMRTISEFKRFGDVGVQVPTTMELSPRTALVREKQMSDLESLLSRERATTGELPWDVLPGTGRGGMGELQRPASSGGPEFVITPEIAERVGINIKPASIGKSTETGTKFEGAPMSQQMLERVINTEISSGVSKPAYRDIDIEIQGGRVASEMRPVIQAAEAQQILPSATTRTFERTVYFDNRMFVDKLETVMESEKRKYSPSQRGISKGVSMDMLREALSSRKGTFENVMRSERMESIALEKPKSNRLSKAATEERMVVGVVSASVRSDKSAPISITGLVSRSKTSDVLGTPVVVDIVTISPNKMIVPETRGTAITVTTEPEKVRIPKLYATPGMPPTPTDILNPIPTRTTRSTTTDTLVPTFIPPIIPITPVVKTPSGSSGGGGAPIGLPRGYGKFVETFYIGPKKSLVKGLRKTAASNILRMPKYK